MKRRPQIFALAVICLSLLLLLPFGIGAAAEENPYGGQDYYIDATGGSDTNDGQTAQTAWQTLAKANSATFAPGDRILLKAGEVWPDQQLWPKGSGSEGKPIVIDAYGDIEEEGLPHIAVNGKVQVPISSASSDKNKLSDKVGLTGGIVLRNQQYWEIHNIEISNDNDFATNITSGLVVRDGINISINADLLTSGQDNIMDYFRISNCYIHDIDGPSTWQKIHYGGINFQVFGNKNVSQYGTGGYYFKDVRIEDNRFERCELHAIQFGFNWFYDRSGSNAGEYDSSGKYHEGWEQLWVRTRNLYSRDVYIGNNYAESTGQGAIQLANIKNLLCEYNEVNGFLKRYNQVSAGLYLWAGADSVMQFNEVYDGPANEYDATPWDLEYTNFNVTYQFNYSHDNKGGWMSYMGNSSNSVARYNLSINDNGVIVKNMLSTNYSPTYFVNNVFVYDASKLNYFHDEVFKDTVYFYNNIFYNTSAAKPTTWYRRTGALNNAVFYNNAYYEAGGSYSSQQPEDPNAVLGDPRFVGDPLSYSPAGIGVKNIRQVAEKFKLRSSSPLIDAGHWSPASGTKDFFETHLYYGDEIDIGLYEAPYGVKVGSPVEKNLGGDEEEPENLALNKPIAANYTHPNAGLEASKLVDGNKATRWASPDPDQMQYPITIDIDFGAETTFNKVLLDEFEDHQTNLRIQTFELMRWDASASSWVTFKSVTDGMGHDRAIDDFGSITTAKLRVNISSQKSSEYWTPSMTEIQVYNIPAPEPEPDPDENLALNKPIAANYTHPNAGLEASKLVDGSKTSRWAAPDPDQMRYPITIDIDFGAATTFNKVLLDEFEDHETNLRIQTFELMRWDASASSWVTFKSVTDGMGHDRVINDFGSITTTKLRVNISSQKSSEYWTPSITEIQVYNVAVKNPELEETVSVYDKNESMAEDWNNEIFIDLVHDGDSIEAVKYYGPEGNMLRELYDGDEYGLFDFGDTVELLISPDFLKTMHIGACKIVLEMESGAVLEFVVNVVDTTELEETIGEAEALKAAYPAIIPAIESASDVLELVNRSMPGTGNDEVQSEDVGQALTELRNAIDNLSYGPGSTKAELEAAVTAAAGLEESNYTEASYAPFETELEKARTLLEGSAPKRIDILRAYNELAEAKEALVLKDADYGEVDGAIASVPEDLSSYTGATADAVRQAVAAVVRGKKIDEQSVVDGYAGAIADAVEALRKKAVKDEDTGATVEYADGSGFESSVVLSVTPKSEDEMKELAEGVDKAAKGFGLVGLYDIRLLRDNEEFQPDGTVRVSIPLTDEMREMAELKVVYIDGDGNVTVIPSRIVGDNLVFEAEHFSIYGVIAKAEGKPDTGYASYILPMLLTALVSGAALWVLAVRRRGAAK